MSDIFEIELDFIDSVSIEMMQEFSRSLTRTEARYMALMLYARLCEMEEVGEDESLSLQAHFAVQTLSMDTIELREICLELWQQIIVSDILFEIEDENNE